MKDTAIQNAENQKNQLLDERKTLKARIKEIDARINKIEEFIADWHAFASGRIDEVVDGVEAQNANEPATTSRKHKKASGNSKKEDVAEGARQIIKQRGEPVSRADLYTALVDHGYTIKGSDPEMVLSTMLWRMRDRVVRLRSGGYWLKERPYPPAGYDPDIEDVANATDDSQPSMIE